MPRTGYIAELREQVGNRLITVPSVTVCIFNEDRQLLLAKHRDGDLWAMPGGVIEPGETPADAAVREAWEELRLLVRPVALLGVFGGPEFEVRYDNGDRTIYVMTVFYCETVDGNLQIDEAELTDALYASRQDLAEMRAPAWMPVVTPEVFDWYEDPSRVARFGQPTWTPQ